MHVAPRARGFEQHVHALVRDHGIAAPALLVIGAVTRAAQAGARAELSAAAE